MHLANLQRCLSGTSKCRSCPSLKLAASFAAPLVVYIWIAFDPVPPVN